MPPPTPIDPVERQLIQDIIDTLLEGSRGHENFHPIHAVHNLLTMFEVKRRTKPYKIKWEHEEPKWCGRCRAASIDDETGYCGGCRSTYNPPPGKRRR